MFSILDVRLSNSYYTTCVMLNASVVIYFCDGLFIFLVGWHCQAAAAPVLHVISRQKDCCFLAKVTGNNQLSRLAALLLTDKKFSICIYCIIIDR